MQLSSLYLSHTVLGIGNTYELILDSLKTVETLGQSAWILQCKKEGHEFGEPGTACYALV